MGGTGYKEGVSKDVEKAEDVSVNRDGDFQYDAKWSSDSVITIQTPYRGGYRTRSFPISMFPSMEPFVSDKSSEDIVWGSRRRA